MQAKNWLFEAALEAGEIQTAISGFIGIRKKTSAYTRVHLEATALLAVCYLRLNQTDKAKPLMQIVLKDDKCIRSERRRRQFRHRIIRRFNEEVAIAALRGSGTEILDACELQDEAGQLLQFTEDELFFRVGASTPVQIIAKIVQMDEFSRNAIPHEEVKFLPSRDDLKQKGEIGRTVFSAFKTVLYKSLCDKNSEVYKAWYTHGVALVLSKTYIGTAVATICLDCGIGIKALAVSVTALLLRFGLDVYCERFKPESVMIGRDEKL